MCDCGHNCGGLQEETTASQGEREGEVRWTDTHSKEN
jgi:hypothetical protein